jgi:hypothetical protein
MQGRSARRASVIAVLEVRRDVQCNDRERDIGERHSGKKDEGIRGTRHLGVGGPDPHCAARLTTPNVDRPRAGAGVALAGIAVSPNTRRSRDSRSSPRRRHRDSFSCPGWLRSGVRAAAHPRQSLPGAAAPGCGPLGAIEHGCDTAAVAGDRSERERPRRRPRPMPDGRHGRLLNKLCMAE